MQNKLQKLQNRSAHALTFSNYDNADTGTELLGWKNLAPQQHNKNIQRSTMVYKSLHGLTPDYLCSKFEKQETEYKLTAIQCKCDTADELSNACSNKDYLILQ